MVDEQAVMHYDYAVAIQIDFWALVRLEQPRCLPMKFPPGLIQVSS